MASFKENLQRNNNNFIVTTNLYSMLSKLNVHIDTIQPKIFFGFISNLSQKDMKITVINDYGSILTFIKIVPQKDKKYVPKHTCFCVPKEFCSYYHYESGTIIENDIFELFKLEPEIINSFVKFKILDEEIDLSNYDESDYENIKCFIDDEEIEPKISSLNSDQLNNVIAYYLKREVFDYVHCFMKQVIEYEPAVDYDYMNQIIDDNIEEDIDDITIKICEYLRLTQCGSKLIDFIGIHQDPKEKTKVKFKKAQEVNIHIATFISQVLMDWIFGNN